MRSFLVIAAALAAAASREAWAAETSIDIGPTRVPGRVMSFRELRDRAVVRQQFDFSCGAAAFATLLRYGFGEAIDEETILRELFADKNAAEQRLIRNKGLSLLDMQKLAKERGYKAQGFRLAPDQLQKLRRPVLVFIQPLGYQHFAVLRGFRGDRAILADPSMGNWSLTLPRFLEMWLDASGRGVIFVIERRDGWPAESPLYLDAPRPVAAPATPRQLGDPPRFPSPPPAFRSP